VFPAMSYNNTSHRLDFLNEVFSLHETSSSATLRTEEIEPLVNSS
jgi:hypothetical protein